MSSTGLKRVRVQSGAEDRLQRPIDGLFEILIDESGIARMLEEAIKNKSRMCRRGAAVVIYHPMPKAQADYIVKQNTLTPPGAGN